MERLNPRDSEPKDALSDAYDRYGSRLFGYLVTVVGSREAAEDILQDIFCRLAARGAFFRVANPENYLFRAAHNEAVGWLKNRRRLPEVGRELESLAATRAETPSEPSSEDVARAIAELPAEQAEVVYLKIYEEMTFEQIGELAGCSINTAASRYRYACEKLQRRLRGAKDE